MENKSAITEFREARDGMTLEAFGKLFDPPVNKSTVMRWELGQLTPKRAIEIERVTGIRRADLMPEIFAVPEAAE